MRSVLLCVITFIFFSTDLLLAQQTKMPVTKNGWDSKDSTHLPGITNNTDSLEKKESKHIKAKMNEQLDNLKLLIKRHDPSAKKEPMKNIDIARHRYKDLMNKPLLKFNNGFISFNTDYRSNIDTPFLEKNVVQHNVYGNLSMSIRNIPLNITCLLRKSNSNYFQNINDIQVAFDVQKFQQTVRSNSISKIMRTAELLKDSISEKLGALKSLEYLNLENVFNSRFSLQRLIEAKELLNVAGLSWDNSLPDSLAKIKSDSLKKNASLYIKLYEASKEQLTKVKSSVDSLKDVYENSLRKVKLVQHIANGSINNFREYQKLVSDSVVRNSGIDKALLKYHWLWGVRKISLGRSSVNYSELTAKNISLNGVNFEYNSWYYLSFSAGLIDYRFLDFVIQTPNRPKQYFSMGRAGIGDISKNYFIVSLFRGQKQLFVSGGNYNLYTVKATGISLEARLQINRLSFIKAEIAETVAPDFRTNPPKNNQWNLREKTDKAYAIAVRFIVPQSQTKIDAVYKYTGANFQSFTSFHTNSSLDTWNIKAEQNFFKKRLHIIAAIKSNEYFNPYLIQTYQSNTIFKSFQGVFRKKGWPVLSAGYMPMTQLTNMGGIVVENKFNSLSTTTYHHYRILDTKAATTVVYTKFYNTRADSGFIYFNATNLFVNQLFYFSLFKATINITHSTNKRYELNVLDENIQVPVKNIAAILFGIKINNLDRQYNKLGCYGNVQFSFLRNSTLSLFYEDGYIPGIGGTLVKNSIGSIQLSKRF
ncbi:MAG: hypothetical protein JWP81_5147 [Ferruginibacter sp.]|nr:hypothetical protein [Ferruginibacter sp.]